MIGVWMQLNYKGVMYVYVLVDFMQVGVNKVDIDTVEYNVVCYKWHLIIASFYVLILWTC